MTGATASFAMFAGDSQLHRLLSAHSWRGGALPHPVMWPPGLRGMVRLMLDSKVPMAIAWGEQYTLLYNDAFVPFLGARHPAMLGRPLAEAWQEGWPSIAPLVERAYGGESLECKAQPMKVVRAGHDGQGRFKSYFSPLRDDDNSIAGICWQLVEAPADAGADPDLTGEGAPAPTVLVVDDNADAAAMLGMLLEAHGYRVLIEHGSHAALATAERAGPDVCVLDIGLPDMDGRDLAARLRQLPATAGAMLVAVTGYGGESDRREALAAGFDHYLVKPVDVASVITLLEDRARQRK